MNIQNVIRIQFQPEDLAAMLRGEIRSVTTSDGLSVQFAVAEGTTRKAIKAAQIKDALAAVNGAEAPRTLGTLRGDCEACDRKGILLASHYRQVHPGKPIPYPGGVECKLCHRGFPSEASMQVHRRNTHKRGKA
jgi:hypothetical protein